MNPFVCVKCGQPLAWGERLACKSCREQDRLNSSRDPGEDPDYGGLAMSEVFLCRLGQLNDRGRRDLRKAGIVVVEVLDPAQCQFIRSTETVSSGDMLWAAIDALNVETGSYGRDQRERLSKNLLTLIEAQRSKDGLA